MEDLVFGRIQFGFARALGAAQDLAFGPGGCQALLCSLGDQVPLYFGKQAEQGDHSLGLDVLLAGNLDIFLDGNEADVAADQWTPLNRPRF